MVFDNREISEMPKDIMDKITEYSMEFSLGKNYLSKLNNFVKLTIFFVSISERGFGPG